MHRPCARIILNVGLSAWKNFISPDGTRIATALSPFANQSSLDALSPEARKNVVTMSPTSSTYVNNRAYVWLEQKKDLDKALTDFDEALRISPTDSSLHIDRGRVRLAQGELDDALASFDKAIEHKPDSGLAYAWRAYVWSATANREKMLQDFNQTIQLSPDDSLVWTLRAWLLATSPNAEHRDGKQAVSDATKACELTDWTDYNCLENLAAAYAESGDFEQAVQWQEKAVSLTPPAQRAVYESRLKLYREGTPFREPMPTKAIAGSAEDSKKSLGETGQ